MGPVATLVLICALLLPIGGAEGRGLRDEPLLYDLTGSDLLGWSSPSGELRPSADGATLPVRGEQSAFLSPGPLGIDASRLDRIELEIRLEPPDGRATPITRWQARRAVSAAASEPPIRPSPTMVT